MSTTATSSNSGATSEFDVESFEQKLTTLKDTQDGIQQMSAWCLQQRAYHKKIVSSWLNVLKQVRVEHRLTLFYLANDVIQYSKRKNYEFVESWGTALQKATTMVRDEKVRNKIFRIFKIWEQREIYSEEYLSDLNGLLSMNPMKKTQQSIESSDDFQNSVLVSNIRDCVKLEKCTDKNFKNLPKVPNCDIEAIKNNLKDRSHSDDAEKDIDEFVVALETYIKSLKSEIKSRKSLINQINQADTFYANLRTDVKVVVNAYRNFGNRIKTVKKKLDEITPNLPSPIPSPDINAPSPEQDADIILPDDQNNISINMFKNSSNGYTSYMDGNLPFDINDFKRESPKKAKYNPNACGMQQIQVINNRSEQKPEDDYNIDFFKANDGPYTSLDVPVPVPPVPNYGALGQQSTASSTYSNNAIVGGGVYSNNLSQASYDDRYNDSTYASTNTNANYETQMPLMPPPMPPLLRVPSDDFNSTWDMDMSWTSMNSSGTFNSSIDTPVSPPHFEREGVNQNLVEYMDNGGLGDEISSLQDVDHRQLHIPSSLGKDKGRTIDVDHRNLISLTGSPGPRPFDSKRKTPNSPSAIWSSNEKDNSRLNTSSSFQKQSEIDTDYRRQMSGDIDYRTQGIQQHGRMQKADIIAEKKLTKNQDVNDSRIKDVRSNSDARELENLSRNSEIFENPFKGSEPPPPGTLHSPPPLPPFETSVFSNLNTFLSSPPNFNSSIALSQSTQSEEGSQNKEGRTNDNPLRKVSARDNVESIDMDMSDEDPEDQNRDKSQILDSASFSKNDITTIDNVNSIESKLISQQGNQRPPLLQTPDIQPWARPPQCMQIPGNMPLDAVNNSDVNNDVTSSMMWKPRMTATHTPQFRMPLNVQQQSQYPRSPFMQSQRGFNPQMKQNFRDQSFSRNSPYFNNNRGNNRNGRNMSPRQHRGGFRGQNKWQ